jgi:hypothetical protein
MKAILTGLMVTAREVNDGTAFHISDFVNVAGLNMHHGELVVK